LPPCSIFSTPPHLSYSGPRPPVFLPHVSSMALPIRLSLGHQASVAPSVSSNAIFSRLEAAIISLTATVGQGLAQQAQANQDLARQMGRSLVSVPPLRRSRSRISSAVRGRQDRPQSREHRDRGREDDRADRGRRDDRADWGRGDDRADRGRGRFYSGKNPPGPRPR
jgi:hypothetical protein